MLAATLLEDAIGCSAKAPECEEKETEVNDGIDPDGTLKIPQ
jgi:hypothetical protein